MKTTLRKRIFIVFLTLAMLVVPLCETLTPTAEAATKKATNKKAKKLYQKKINQLRKSVGGVHYKYTDINRDGITDVMIEYWTGLGANRDILIYTYKNGKLVNLFATSLYGMPKIIGYKGGVIVHILDGRHGWEYYRYYKKASSGKYSFVAEKGRPYPGAEWTYWVKGTSEESSTKAAFNRQIKKVKTGTRKYYGWCDDWTCKSE